MTALTLLIALAAAGEPTTDAETSIATPGEVTDGTHLWTRQAVAVAGWPSGAISDTRVQIRAPLHRSDSIVFQDTFVGAGARIAATPAFTEAGPRISIAPIDVFDMDLSASYVRYYGGEGIGLANFSETRGTLQSDRSEMGSVQADAIRLTAAPTVKLKLGPIVAFDSWTVSYTSIAPSQEHETGLVYEPFTDLVVAWKDVTVEQQGAVIYEVVPDEGGAFFWAGATARDKFAVQSKDRSTAVGAVLRGRPGKGKAVPTLVGQALFYVNDVDRLGGVPNLALLADWKFHNKL